MKVFSCSKNILSFFAVIARLLVACHFIYELVDKISRFRYWREIITKQSGLGTWSLVLVILLLFIGSTCLVLGRHLWVGAFCLILFQVPTSIRFEDNLYESFDSTSAIGGVISIAVMYTKPKQQTQSSNKLSLMADGGHKRQEEFRRLPGSSI